MRTIQYIFPIFCPTVRPQVPLPSRLILYAYINISEGRVLYKTELYIYTNKPCQLITSNYSDIILQIIKIQDEIVDASTTIDEATKQGIRLRSAMLISTVANQPKLNAYGFKSLLNELLIYWNHNISPDTEKFWDALNSNNLPVERKDLIKDALAREHFKTVEQGIDARNNWAVLSDMSLITERFSPEQISQVAQIIAADEQKRHAILQKTLTTGKIPQTQYLKFGECMAYFANCLLFRHYFTQAQTDELYGIWQDFKYQ